MMDSKNLLTAALGMLAGQNKNFGFSKVEDFINVVSTTDNVFESLIYCNDGNNNNKGGLNLFLKSLGCSVAKYSNDCIRVSCSKAKFRHNMTAHTTTQAKQNGNCKSK